MQSYCLEPTEDMALRNEDKEWIAEEIRVAIQTHLNSHGWRKLRAFLPLASVLTIFLALLALAGAGWNYAFSRIAAEAKFQEHVTGALSRTDERLTHIENTLGLLQAQSVAQKYSSVPSKELKAHSEELKQTKAVLAQLPPTSPTYWPVAFQVIRLVSLSTFMDFNKIAAGPELTLNYVTSRPPGAINIPPNRRVFLSGHVEGIVLRNCVVRFDPDVELVNDVFIDCVFLLPIQENPSKPLQEIGKTLLTSDLSKVTLNAS